MAKEMMADPNMEQKLMEEEDRQDRIMSKDRRLEDRRTLLRNRLGME